MDDEINYGKRKTFDVLDKIQKLIKVNPEGNLLMYKIEDFFNPNNNSIKEDEILYDLRKWGALKIEDKERIDNEIIYYLKILPKFKDVYIDHKKFIKEKRQEMRYSKFIANKLYFHPKSGDAEYKTAMWGFRGKGRAFLTILCENKNMNFNVKDIIKHCNPLITIKKYEFRDTKDISDTLREIRFRLKAKKGEFFPILKQENGWIWLEK